MQTSKLLLFVGLSLITGFIWGYALAPEVNYRDTAQHYSDPQIPIGQYDEMVSVDVIRNSDDIWIVEHYTGRLIFEYHRFERADAEAFREYEDLLIEALSRK